MLKWHLQWLINQRTPLDEHQRQQIQADPQLRQYAQQQQALDRQLNNPANHNPTPAPASLAQAVKTHLAQHRPDPTHRTMPRSIAIAAAAMLILGLTVALDLTRPGTNPQLDSQQFTQNKTPNQPAEIQPQAIVSQPPQWVDLANQPYEQEWQRLSEDTRQFSQLITNAMPLAPTRNGS